MHIGKTFLIQAQPEYNWINFKISEDGNPDNKTSEIARSFLAGIGFTFRNVGQFNFFCVVMIDLQNELYSPYRTNAREVMPITRIGMNFYFGRKKKSN